VPLTRPYRIGLVAVVIGGIVAGAAVLSSAETQATPRAIPTVMPVPLAVDIGVQKQLAYVLAHWKNYNLAEYGLVGHNDCVDFASQSLIARGWAMDRDWWSKGSGSSFTFSKAWVSSTSLMRYLAASGRATALTDAQRDKVKLGDIVQFDWDKSGDRDHTGIVTRIERLGGKITIYYAGHTDDTDYRSVDWAITVNHPGGLAYYWSIP
jgi:hypothetical protein